MFYLVRTFRGGGDENLIIKFLWPIGHKVSLVCARTDKIGQTIFKVSLFAIVKHRNKNPAFERSKATLLLWFSLFVDFISKKKKKKKKKNVLLLCSGVARSELFLRSLRKNLENYG